MAGFGAEVGDDLRDFRNSPADQTDQTKPKGEMVSEIAETVPKVLVNPSDAGLLLLDTVRWRHGRSPSPSHSPPIPKFLGVVLL